MTLDLSKIKGVMQESIHPENFYEGRAVIAVEAPQSASKYGRIIFNEEAIGLTGLFKLQGEKIINRILFLPDYLVNKKYEAIIHITIDEVVELDKKYNTYLVNSTSNSVASKKLHNDIQQKFQLDNTITYHYFIVEPTENPAEKAFTLSLITNVVLNEGVDEPVQMIQLSEDKTTINKEEINQFLDN